MPKGTKKGYQTKCESDLECDRNLRCLKSHSSTEITCLCGNNKNWNGETCGE